ncbi:HAMP domain-containing sensor histidine kinase [Undibacterium cyanobacteriorum]|uniref:histidine kinase n=1 Tax=Undibacterium cyanobacteriorum TaxID=3073561 RepID=A0ABY9RJM5_9BURK|nr:HAMP domain-containing sensor histidine kinase [Undibacterium sp. 20NA77.5]WMW81438.1 HAMP domain-containing sensor histidine kinase [Undibacterium sp. 20NA77.5]
MASFRTESSSVTPIHPRDQAGASIDLLGLLEKGRLLCVSGQFDEIPQHLDYIKTFELEPICAVMLETLQLYPNANNGHLQDSQRLQRLSDLLELAKVLDSKLAQAWAWELMQLLQNNLLLHHAALHSNAMAVELFEQCDRKREAFTTKVSRCLIMVPCEMYREVIEMGEQLLREREHLDPVALCNILRSSASANYFLGIETDGDQHQQFLQTALSLHEECLRIAKGYQIHKFELISHTNIAIINAYLGRREPTTYHLLKIEGMQVNANKVNPSWGYWLRFCEALLLCESPEFERGWEALIALDLELRKLDLSTAAVHDSVLRKIISYGRRWHYLEIALDASLALAELNSKRRRLLSQTLSATVEDIMSLPRLVQKNQELSQQGHQLEASLARQNAELNNTLEQLRAEANIRKKAEYALHQAHAKLEQQIQARTQELEAAMDVVMRQEKQLALGRLVVGIAHEMNTPLGNALMAASTMDDYCQQLSADLSGTSLKRSQLQISLHALHEGNRLLRRALDVASNLVQRFRALAIEQHTETIQNFDLQGLCAGVVADWQKRFQERQAELSMYSDTAVRIRSYPNALTQVLEQILENCLFHGLTSGELARVELHLYQHGQEIELQVSDNGNGIAQDHLGRLFEPFFSRQLGQGGMGLGLSIAHSLITDLMRGHITIANRPEGGTCVTIRIPTDSETSFKL